MQTIRQIVVALIVRPHVLLDVKQIVITIVLQHVNLIAMDSAMRHVEEGAKLQVKDLLVLVVQQLVIIVVIIHALMHAVLTVNLPV